MIRGGKSVFCPKRTIMKVNEIRTELEQHSKKVYALPENNDSMEKKSILVVSHCLDRGGAPLVLLELMDIFIENYNVVFISMADGDLNQEFLNKGFSIYIGNCFDYARVDEGVWQSFDSVFLNTIVTYNFISFFQNRDVKVFWWLHEPEVLFNALYGKMMHLALLSKNIKVLSVTQDTAQCVKKYYGVDSEILHMGLKDCWDKGSQEKHEKIRFFMPAKFQMIKGQDILAQAILNLEPQYANKVEFIFAGPRDESQPEYYDLIEKLSIALENVIMLGEISKEEVYEWYNKVDCVIAPSRADATPTTIVEGMMFGKICICSNATGISKYMTDTLSEYIFETENIEAICEIIRYIVDNYTELDGVREAVRKIYLEHFEKGKIENRLKTWMLK